MYDIICSSHNMRYWPNRNYFSFCSEETGVESSQDLSKDSQWQIGPPPIFVGPNRNPHPICSEYKVVNQANSLSYRLTCIQNGIKCEEYT